MFIRLQIYKKRRKGWKDGRVEGYKRKEPLWLGFLSFTIIKQQLIFMSNLIMLNNGFALFNDAKVAIDIHLHLPYF